MGKTSASRKRLWIRLLVLGILLSPIALFFALSVTINLHSIPSEQKKPPAEILKTFRVHSKPNPGSQRPSRLPSPLPEFKTPRFEEYLKWRVEREPDNKGAALYLKLRASLNDDQRKDISRSLPWDDLQKWWRRCLGEGQPFPSDLDSLLDEDKECFEIVLRFAETE